MCAVFTFIVQLSLLHIFLVRSSAVDQKNKQTSSYYYYHPFPVCFFFFLFWWTAASFFFVWILCVSVWRLWRSHMMLLDHFFLFLSLSPLKKWCCFYFFNFFLSWRSSMLLVGCFSRSFSSSAASFFVPLLPSFLYIHIYKYINLYFFFFKVCVCVNELALNATPPFSTIVCVVYYNVVRLFLFWLFKNSFWSTCTPYVATRNPHLSPPN